MSGDWNILGIAPTDDPRELKRAYARVLRIYRPDQDPKGFQKLRDSYERLLSLLEHRLGTSAQDEQDEEEVATELEASVAATKPLPAQSADDPAENLLQDWLAVWNDLNRRYKEKEWKHILRRDELWSQPIRNALEWRILTCMRDVHAADPFLCQMIPFQVWYDLNRVFDWSHREFQLAQWLPPQFSKEMFQRIHHAERRVATPLNIQMEQRAEQIQSLTGSRPIRPQATSKDEEDKQLPFWVVILAVWLLILFFRMVGHG